MPDGRHDHAGLFQVPGEVHGPRLRRPLADDQVHASSQHRRAVSGRVRTGQRWVAHGSQSSAPLWKSCGRNCELTPVTLLPLYEAVHLVSAPCVTRIAFCCCAFPAAGISASWVGGSSSASSVFSWTDASTATNLQCGVGCSLWRSGQPSCVPSTNYVLFTGLVDSAA